MSSTGTNTGRLRREELVSPTDTAARESRDADYEDVPEERGAIQWLDHLFSIPTLP